MKNQKELTIVLAILLILAVGYIVIDKYTTYKEQKEQELIQQGAQKGYEQAILQIAQQAATCNQVPLLVGNQSLNIIAVDCIK